MELRPELLPPVLDEGLVARLSTLVDGLDGAAPDDAADDLAEFNRLAGRALHLETFQGIYRAEDHETWVRRILWSQHIKPAVGVTHAELVEVVRRAIPSNEYFEQHEAYMAIFDANVPLPHASCLIFCPPDDWAGGPIAEYEPTPEELVEWALRHPPAPRVNIPPAPGS